MARYFWEQKKLLFIGYLIYVIAFLFKTGSYFAQMETMGSAMSKDLPRLLFFVVLQFGALIMFHILQMVKEFFHQKAFEKAKTSMRNTISRLIGRKNYQEFRTTQIGDYISWYTSDVNQMDDGLQIFCGMLVFIIQLIVSIAALVYIHWSLAVLSVVTSSFIILSTKLFQRNLEKCGHANSEAQEVYTSSIKDLLSGLGILKTFGSLNRFFQQSEQASKEREAVWYHGRCAEKRADAGISSFNYLGQAINIVLMFLLGVWGIIPIQTVFGGGSLVSIVNYSLEQLSLLLVQFSTYRPYFKKFEENDAKFPTESLQALPAFENKISFQNISFSYPNKPVLSQLNLEFERGKKYALVGPSGCGKSTVFHLIMGQLQNYTGDILFDQTNAREIDPDSLSRQIAYIEQDVYLFNSTIRDNITLGHSFAEEQLEKALKNSALLNDLPSLPNGLDTAVGENGNNLSGGQKQRIAIARALIHDRSILLVDEGTSALDQKNAEIVENCLLQTPNLTLILISHHLSEEKKRQFDAVYELKPLASANKEG